MRSRISVGNGIFGPGVDDGVAKETNGSQQLREDLFFRESAQSGAALRA